jgi:hypothetical protein
VSAYLSPSLLPPPLSGPALAGARGRQARADALRPTSRRSRRSAGGYAAARRIGADRAGRLAASELGRAGAPPPQRPGGLCGSAAPGALARTPERHYPRPPVDRRASTGARPPGAATQAGSHRARAVLVGPRPGAPPGRCDPGLTAGQLTRGREES